MTPWVLRLIIANVVVFLLQQTIPGVNSLFAFRGDVVFPTRLWTPITYMFLHGGLGHIFFNMLGLYFFGPRVEERLGSRSFIWLYVVSGLFGALLSLVFTPGAWIVGASGALYGVMLAFAYYWPREQIYIWGILPVEARWLVIIWTVMALFMIRTGGQGGVAHFAHLGGFLGGWIYLKLRERHSPAKQWQAKVTKPAGTVDVKRIKTIDMSRVHEVNREELNRILDKISASGVDSLTSSERTFLSHFAGPKDDRPAVH